MGDKFDLWKHLDRLRDVEKAKNLQILAEDIQRRRREELMEKMTPEERQREERINKRAHTIATAIEIPFLVVLVLVLLFVLYVSITSH